MEEKKCPFCGHELEFESEFLGEKVYRCSNCDTTVCFGKEMNWKGMEWKRVEKELRGSVPTRAETEMNRLDGARNGTAMR